MIIDPSNLDPQSVYKLLIGSVVPRPIAWTSTVSREGVRNLEGTLYTSQSAGHVSAA